MKIFIDVDNTMIEHSSFYTTKTESRIHASIGSYPIDNKEAIKAMYKTSVCRDPEVLRALFVQENVYILTKYQELEYEKYKRKRVAGLLKITETQLKQMTDKNGIPKYISLQNKESKVDIVKKYFQVDNLKDLVLVDDYSQNIIEWENANGIGIKYYNEYNSPNHPLNGISISNFKLFEFYINKKELTNLILVSKNRYKMNLFQQSLFQNDQKVIMVDALKIVFEDLKNKLQVALKNESHHHHYVEFVIDYYNFMDHINPSYWCDMFTQYVKDKKQLFLLTEFEPNFNNLLNNDVINNDNTLKVNTISAKYNHPDHIYDVYLTVNDQKTLRDINNIYEELTNNLAALINKK